MEWTCVYVLFISLQLHLAPCAEGARGHSVSLLALTVVLALNCPTGGEAAFNVSLELQGDCSDQLTLICRHSDVPTDPNWIHNGTVESGQVLATAFHGAMYSFQSNTEHRVAISGVGNVQALDGYIIQCVYSIQGNLTKSNAVKYTFIPPDYRPALSLVSFTSNFSERLSTFTYSYQESCSLYPRCTPYFSVEHTVSPQSAVSNSSSGCSVEYTIRNLMRCVSYQSTATALIRSQRGNSVVMGDTVMLSPGQFTITSVSIGADRNVINVTYMENESDCPGYPTERYTVDVDGVKVADLTADEFQSKITDLSNAFLTLSLPLNQPLPENAVTLNMAKYNTVPTNRSDNMGNIVTEMVTWGTSAVFALQESPPPGGEPPTAVNVIVVIGVSVSFGILVLGGGTAVIIVFIICRNKMKKCLQPCIWCLQACIRCLQPCIRCLQPCIRCLQPCIRCLPLLMLTVCKKKKEQESTVNPPQAEPGYATTRGHDDHEWVKGAAGQLPMPTKEKCGVRKAKEMGLGRQAAQRQHYAELDFADRRPIPPPPSDMFVVAYAEVGQA